MQIGQPTGLVGATQAALENSGQGCECLMGELRIARRKRQHGEADATAVGTSALMLENLAQLFDGVQLMQFLRNRSTISLPRAEYLG